MKAVSVPTDRIAQAISPTDAQRSGLDALNDATRKAADFLKAHCPTDPTLTPPGRVTAMEQRLKAMLEAINIVQPALENFYGSLTDEQKARFNRLARSRAKANSYRHKAGFGRIWPDLVGIWLWLNAMVWPLDLFVV